MRRTQETLAATEHSELLRTQGIFKLIKAIDPSVTLDNEPSKENITIWIDTILTFWLGQESIQAIVNFNDKLAFIERRLGEIIAQRAERAYRFAAEREPLIPIVELAESTYQVGVFKRILLTLMESRVYPWVQYPIERIDVGSILKRAEILKGLEIHRVLKIDQSNLYFVINDQKTVERLCSEIEEKQKQLVSNWIRFFAIGVTANFSDFAFDEQVRYLAKSVLGKDTTTSVSIGKLIAMLNTEMQNQAKEQTDFWTSTASDVVYPD